MLGGVSLSTPQTCASTNMPRMPAQEPLGSHVRIVSMGVGVEQGICLYVDLYTKYIASISTTSAFGMDLRTSLIRGCQINMEDLGCSRMKLQPIAWITQIRRQVLGPNRWGHLLQYFARVMAVHTSNTRMGWRPLFLTHQTATEVCRYDPSTGNMN